MHVQHQVQPGHGFERRDPVVQVRRIGETFAVAAWVDHLPPSMLGEVCQIVHNPSAPTLFGLPLYYRTR